MLLGFKTKLKLNKLQQVLLAKQVGTARHTRKWGLALTKQILNNNKANPSDKIKFLTAIDLHKCLVGLVKLDNLWYYKVSQYAPSREYVYLLRYQYAFKQLRDARFRCFNKLSEVPRFKKKGRKDNFTWDESMTVKQFKIRVPVIGWLKIYDSGTLATLKASRLAQGFTLKSVTIFCQRHHWFISLKIDIAQAFTQKLIEFVGVDLGIKSLATLSTGLVSEGVKSYKKYESKLSRPQDLLRHKQVGSYNYKKAQMRIARLCRTIATIRNNTLHKLTIYISKNNAVMRLKNLNVLGMIAFQKLSKAIGDINFYEFRRQLEYKCQLYDSKLVLVHRFYFSSKTDSNCGVIKKSLLLSERVFKCDECLFDYDRDFNASINLENGKSSVVSNCGLDSAGTSRILAQ